MKTESMEHQRTMVMDGLAIAIATTACLLHSDSLENSLLLGVSQWKDLQEANRDKDLRTHAIATFKRCVELLEKPD